MHESLSSISIGLTMIIEVEELSTLLCIYAQILKKKWYPISPHHIFDCLLSSQDIKYIVPFAIPFCLKLLIVQKYISLFTFCWWYWFILLEIFKSFKKNFCGFSNSQVSNGISRFKFPLMEIYCENRMSREINKTGSRKIRPITILFLL